ncbi:MAG: BrnA antitoxin family protein [Methylobacteriaceae bacterium]|nr:BrnA antitoxin family protein [Methylobacteriaceae bacterium]MBV9392824.1 BrnA antitoxin family protein [Methylobacteriaceae bacterium]
MASKPNPGLIDDDAPEFTDEQLAGMRPAREVLPPDFYAMVTKRRPGQRGPGKKPAKVAMTIRVDADTLAAWKASGAGWQRRVNDVLRKAVKGRGNGAKRSTRTAKRA